MLSPEELAELESSLLPALERHHLRLLAHSLRSLQAAAGRRSGPLPPRAQLQAWAQQQPALQADPSFCQAFLDQLQGAGIQLEAIAAEGAPGRTASQPLPAAADLQNQPVGPDPASPDLGGPLALTLADLLAWARRQADQRIEKIGAADPSP